MTPKTSRQDRYFPHDRASLNRRRAPTIPPGELQADGCHGQACLAMLPPQHAHDKRGHGTDYGVFPLGSDRFSGWPADR